MQDLSPIGTAAGTFRLPGENDPVVLAERDRHYRLIVWKRLPLLRQALETLTDIHQDLFIQTRNWNEEIADHDLNEISSAIDTIDEAIEDLALLARDRL